METCFDPHRSHSLARLDFLTSRQVHLAILGCICNFRQLELVLLILQVVCLLEFGAPPPQLRRLKLARRFSHEVSLRTFCYF